MRKTEGLGYVHLEKRRLMGDTVALFKYLKCCLEEGKEMLLAAQDWTHNNGFKRGTERNQLDIRVGGLQFSSRISCLGKW